MMAGPGPLWDLIEVTHIYHLQQKIAVHCLSVCLVEELQPILTDVRGDAGHPGQIVCLLHGYIRTY